LNIQCTRKVRAEIARKQKDAEFKLARSAAAASPAPRAGAREGAGSPAAAASLASAMSEGTTGYMDVGAAGAAGAAAGAAEASELSRVRTQLAEQDSKWRTAYEKVMIHHDTMTLTHDMRPTHVPREQTDTTLTPARLSCLCVCVCVCLCLGSFPFYLSSLLTR
jgi:hypothetical protein